VAVDLCRGKPHSDLRLRPSCACDQQISSASVGRRLRWSNTVFLRRDAPNLFGFGAIARGPVAVRYVCLASLRQSGIYDDPPLRFGVSRFDPGHAVDGAGQCGLGSYRARGYYGRAARLLSMGHADRPDRPLAAIAITGSLLAVVLARIVLYYCG
jgi:hypothetical protein